MKQLFSALLLLSGYLAYSQPYALDFTFNPGSGAMNGNGAGPVASIFVESNGQIVVGGGFETFNGQSRNGVARLNSDGSVDTNFFVGQGPGPDVSAVAAQTNGMILIGGYFNSVNGVDQQSLARLRIDGSLDINFTPNIQASYGITSILQQPDGDILVAGGIYEVDGEAMSGIARLTFNGALDATFFPALTS